MRKLFPMELAALWDSELPIVSSSQAELGNHVWRNDQVQVSFSTVFLYRMLAFVLDYGAEGGFGARV